MYIKEIEFVNFKSFGKKVKIPFIMTLLQFSVLMEVESLT